MHTPLLAVMQRTDINAATKALAALVYAHTNGSGYAEIPLAELVPALGVGEHKLRSYRAALHRLGYMQSSVSGGCLIVDVNLAWCAPVERAEVARPDEQRAEAARSEPTEAPESAPCGRATADQRAASARSDAKSAPCRRALPPTPPGEREELINLTIPEELTPPPPPAPPAAEQQATRELLARPEIALSYRRAAEIAAAYPFRHVLAHALAWQAERRDNAKILPGLLAWRIANQPAPAVDLEVLYLPSDMLGEFHRAARSLLVRLEPPAQPEPAVADAPEEPAPEPELVAGPAPAERAVWETALSQLRMQLPKTTFETWVRSTELLQREGDGFTVAVGNQYARDWLDVRLRPLITRTLAGIVGRPVTVAFSVPEAV